MRHFAVFLILKFGYSHYEDWNEVWQGDKAQGRKGLVSKDSLAPSLAPFSQPIRIHQEKYYVK